MAVCCSDFNSYALADAGEVICWGSNSKGQLGNGRFVSDELQDDPLMYIDKKRGNRPIVASKFKGDSSYFPLIVDKLKHERVVSVASAG